MFTEIPTDLFEALFNRARDESYQVEDATSEFRDEPGTRYWINGHAGYAIRSDGELVYVHSWTRGQGPAIMASALANGATYLDCFDGYLTGFYARHGFVETHREANWTPGGPDVVYMRRYVPAVEEMSA